MKTNILITPKRKRKGFTLVELLVVIAIIASLAGLSYGPIMSKIESSKLTEAISNGRNLQVALVGFMSQNDGSYPSDDTGTAETAEDCLQQLINSGDVNEEKYFWNKHNAKADLCSISKPDNNGTLTASENVWGYVKNLDPGSDTSQPLLFDSCLSADDTGATFSTAPWKGKAVILKVDGSCTAMKITFSGKPTEDNGDAKTGPVEEKGGSEGNKRDIFSALPSYAEPLTTRSGS